MMPLVRMFAYAFSGVFFTMPFCVANIRNCSSLPKSFTASTLAIFSPCWKLSRFASGSGPGLVRLISGTSYTRRSYTRPLVGEDHQVVVRVGDEQVLDEIAFLRFGSLHAASTAALGRDRCRRGGA
jgi:hypothetical protein